MTSGSPTPTTATSGRYRAFYEQPEPVVFDVELPDDIDGPDDLRDYLLDDAPFAKVSAVRVEPVGQDGPVRTPGVAVERLDPGSEGAGTPEAARGDSAAEPEEDFNDERHDLAMIIHDGGCQCRGHTLGWTIRARDSLQLADAVLAAGFRRVPEDAEQSALERLAGELERRADERDADPQADEDEPCDGLCSNGDCHRMSAVATWHRAARLTRRVLASVVSVSGGGEQP